MSFVKTKLYRCGNGFPSWLTIEKKVDQLDPTGGLIYVGNAEILKNLCPGEFGKIDNQGICMIGLRK